MLVPAHVKYQVIQEMSQSEDNLLNIKWLCEAAGVSRSGYYHYLSVEDLRQQKEEQDRLDFLTIVKAYQHRGYDKGARGIYMRLLHLSPPVHMNIKKIWRLMIKFNLFCPIRKANPYRRMAKAMATACKSIKFIQLVNDRNLRQSISHKANCWDNASQESFYWHMKGEIDISWCTTFDEIHPVIADWTDYYNNERYQWDLAKLAPREYYRYQTTGIYPLTTPKAKGRD